MFLRFVAISFAVMLGLVPRGAAPETTPAPLPSSSEAPTATAAGPQDAALASIAKRFFDDGFRETPSAATTTGVHRYDRDLDDVSAAAYARHLARISSTLTRLRALDAHGLSPDSALDRTMLENAILDDRLLTGTLEQWKHDPDAYVNTASSAIYALIERRFASSGERLADTIARERQIPRFLEQARANLTSVDAPTKQIALEDAAGAVDFFVNDVPQAFSGVGDSATRVAFRQSTAAAKAAMLRFATGVRAISPSGTFAIGADAYEKRLQYEDSIDMPVSAYLAVGEGLSRTIVRASSRPRTVSIRMRLCSQRTRRSRACIRSRDDYSPPPRTT